MSVVLRIAAALVLAAFLSTAPPSAAAVGAGESPSVLILNSYHQGYEWSDREIEGLLEGLHTVHPGMAPVIEHLDLKRFSEEVHENRLRGFLADKYRDQRIDLAVILDNPAFDLILSHRDEILPGVPVVFAGVNDFTPLMLKGQNRITGVAEVQDYQGTLSLALALQPGTRQVLAVHDYTASGRAVRHEMEAVFPAFRDRVQVSFNDPSTYEEMAAQIAELPPDSLVLILSFATDSADKSLTPDQSTAVLTAQARVPVYAMHETRLGHGIVGGMLIGGAVHGRSAAALALRVLAGEDPASIPVETQSTSQPMFDYVQLQRFEIPPDALPAGSVLVNRPVSLYEQHKPIIWGAAGIIGLLLVLVGSLLFLLQRKNSAERALRESEARYRIVADNTYDWEYWADPQGRFLYVSPSCKRISGYSAEEYMKRADLWRDIILPEDKPKWDAHSCVATHQQQAEQIEFCIRRADGEVRWISHVCRPVFDPKGPFLGSRGSNRDVTERMQMVVALRESEARFRLLYEKAPLPYQSLDENGNFIEVNQAFLAVLGYAREEVIGRNFGEFLAPDWGEHFKQNFRRFKAVGEVLGVEFEMVKKDGSRILVSFNGKIAHDDQGRFKQTDCIFTDITERSRAEKELQTQRDMLKSIFESSPFIMMLVDQDVRVKRINRVGAGFAGRPKEEILGLLCGEVVKCINSFDGLGCGRNAVCGECLVRAQVVHTLKTGETILDAQGKFAFVRGSQELMLDMLISTARVKVADEDFVLVTMSDVTERVRAVTALQASEERYRMLFEEMTSAFALHEMIFDESGKPCDYKFQKVNPAFEKLTGLRAGDVVGRLVSEVIPGIDFSWIARFGKVVLTGESVQFDDYSGQLDKYFEVRAFCPSPGQFAVIFQDITSRKKAETELQESEARFRVVVESAPDAIFVQSAGRFAYLNSSACRLFGASRPEDLLGRDFMERTAPECRDNIRERIRFQRETGKPSTLKDQKYLRLDGTQVPVETTAVSIKYYGEDAHMVFARDITERKQAEDYREMGREVLQILNEPVDLQDSIQRVLAAMKTWTGFDAVGIRLQDGDDFPYFAQQGFSKDFLLTENTLIERAADGGVCRDKDGNLRLECTCGLVISGKTDPAHPLFTPGGSCWTNDSFPLLDLPSDQDPRLHPRNQCIHQGYASVALVPIRNTDRVVGLIQLNDRRNGRFTLAMVEILEGIASHIGSALMRRRVEEALRDSEERHRKIIEASSDAFLLRSKEIIIYANPAALKLFRANHPEDLIGKPYLDLVHPDDRALTVERVKRAINENWTAPPREHRILALDGQVVHAESIGGLVKQRGEPHVFGVFRDITKRKQAEQEKEKLEEQLRQAQKMEAIGTLAGGIAHDFNNILSVIVGNAEILEFENALGDSSQGGLNQILAASQRAKLLVRQILAFSRHGKQEKILIDVKPIVKETLEFLRASLPTSIELRHYLEPDTGTIMADPTQMQQVLMNLCTNAGHSMEKEGGSLQIKLSNTAITGEDARFDPEVEPGNYLKLTVSDTGHGMEPSVLQRIFEPYFTTKEPGKGTGLGLAVVHGIVKSHGGKIKVYSEVGNGTTFTIFLPHAMGFEKVEDKPMQPLSMGTEKILFVDDEEALTDLGRQMLGGLGYQVKTRTSPIEALEAFRANPQKFDLVITDMTMPQMSGLNLARKIMEIRPGMPIIICTGFSEQANEQAAGAMGIRAFLYKPLVMRDIAGAVRKVLDECNAKN